MRHAFLLVRRRFPALLLAVGLAAALLAPSPVRAAYALPAPQPAASNPTNAAAPSPAPPSPAAAQDIRDIRGPLAVPTPGAWLLWLAGGAVLAVLAYLVWRWIRRLRSAPRLAYQVALDRLEKARALMRPETAREFSIEVSEIVRHYIEARFRVHAAHQTTEEFLHDLLEPSDALLAGHRDLLADFLEHCDLAKFARWILSVEEMEGMHASARTFVLETGKPQAAAAAPAVRPTPTAVPASSL
jgi:hypothetical protein